MVALRQTLVDAEGGQMPACTSTYREWLGDIIWYDVHFPSWGLDLSIPMPEMAVIMDLSNKNPRFTAELHKEYAEAYIQDFQLTALAALSYTLMTFRIQRRDVQDILDFRLGPLLDQAIKDGTEYWLEICKA